MSKMAQYNDAQEKHKYSTKILEAVKSVECKGKLKAFFQNRFTYIRVSDDFSSIPTMILQPFGFQEVPLMEKANSPKTHISVMTYAEQRRVTRRQLKQVLRKWKNTVITFTIECVQTWPHTVKETGEKKWICCFKISSNHIEAIRVELGLESVVESFNMHLTVCEKLM